MEVHLREAKIITKFLFDTTNCTFEFIFEITSLTSLTSGSSVITPK